MPRLSFRAAWIALIFGVGVCIRSAGAFAFLAEQGARQLGMGEGGVALPDAAQGALFNPALPALSVPWDKVSLFLHPDWQDVFDTHTRIKAWNGPVPGLQGMGPGVGSLARIPSAYVPRLGYLAFDQREFVADELLGPQLETSYALTFAPAVDFLGEEAGRTKRHAWTGGLALKWFSTRAGTGPLQGQRLASRGFAFDLGCAGRSLPARLPGLRIDWGLAFANLGPPETLDYGGGERALDALDARYRLGYSLEYVPFRLRRAAPVRIAVQQELGKGFRHYRKDGQPDPFFVAFAKDFDVPAARYWRETEFHSGAEATVFDVAHARVGRFRQADFSDYRSHPWYTFGYGLDSGPWLGPAFLRFDYGREFNTRERRRDTFFPVRRDYGFVLGCRF